MAVSAVDARDSVIDRVYSAASGLIPWSDALALLSGYCGAQASYINLVTDTDRSTCTVGAHGHSPSLLERYRNYGQLVDPTTPQIIANAGHPISYTGLLLQEIGGREFHREFIASRGTDQLLALGLKSEVGTLLVKLSSDSSGQLLSSASINRLLEIAAHVRQAVVIDRSVRRRVDSYSFASTIVDRLRAAVIRLDGDRVTFANRATYRLAEDGALISIRDGRFRFVESEALETFRGFMRKASANGGEWSQTMLLSSGEQRRRIRVWAWSSKGAPLAEIGLMILPDDYDAGVLEAALRENYGLTPSEIRTALGVITHNGLAAVAEHSGVSVETVRFHLKRIFSKTGTSRQSELVRIIANDLCCVDVSDQHRAVGHM